MSEIVAAALVMYFEAKGLRPRKPRGKGWKDGEPSDAKTRA